MAEYDRDTTHQVLLTQRRRYVVQKHIWGNATHYDFMFEVPNQERLRSFQIPEEPDQARCQVGIGCRELPPHRREYLTYQGEVSRGRGVVEIWDSGWLQPLKEGARMLEYRMHSEHDREHATWVLHETGGGRWHLMSPNYGCDRAFQEAVTESVQGPRKG